MFPQHLSSSRLLQGVESTIKITSGFKLIFSETPILPYNESLVVSHVTFEQLFVQYKIFLKYMHYGFNLILYIGIMVRKQWRKQNNKQIRMKKLSCFFKLLPGRAQATRSAGLARTNLRFGENIV